VGPAGDGGYSIVGRTFLITGGTGSFGQAMVRRLLDAGAGQVRVFSRDEAKQEALRLRLRDGRIRSWIGDVRDPDSVSKAARGVDFAFHAAALKQVPSCDLFPLEAVATNVLGASHVVDACERNGVAGLVLLSTDKAVYPVNTMGITKALMERVAQAHARGTPRNHTRVACVRYGNVMYSRSSVIPLFVDQVRQRRPVTVTDPAMTRFLMSLAESVQLVEHAFLHAQPGDVFVRKASACTIGDLAAAVCGLFGAPPTMDILGVRHGEKMHETLATGRELTRADDLGSHYRIPVDSRDLNYALYVHEGDPAGGVVKDYTSDTAPRLTVGEITTLLLGLPEIQAHLSPVAA
jgi:UDP-glucose 4-epimerase